MTTIGYIKGDTRSLDSGSYTSPTPALQLLLSKYQVIHYWVLWPLGPSTQYILIYSFEGTHHRLLGPLGLLYMFKNEIPHHLGPLGILAATSLSIQHYESEGSGASGNIMSRKGLGLRVGNERRRILADIL